MTPSVAIGGGKQTVQRISIRFPKREGQSRVRILSDFGHGAWLWFAHKRDLPPPSFVHGHAGGGRQMTAGIFKQIHPLLILARPLVKSCKEPTSGLTKIFHVVSNSIPYASNRRGKDRQGVVKERQEFVKRGQGNE